MNVTKTIIVTITITIGRDVRNTKNFKYILCFFTYLKNVKENFSFKNISTPAMGEFFFFLFVDVLYVVIKYFRCC